MSDIAHLICALESAIDLISFRQLILFIDLCAHLRPLIDHGGQLANTNVPPLWLQQNVQIFLKDALSSLDRPMDIGIIQELWDRLSRLIWSLGHRPASKALLPLFLEYGTPQEIGRYAYICILSLPTYHLQGLSRYYPRHLTARDHRVNQSH
jgi:hypothetical protein